MKKLSKPMEKILEKIPWNITKINPLSAELSESWKNANVHYLCNVAFLVGEDMNYQ